MSRRRPARPSDPAAIAARRAAERQARRLREAAVDRQPDAWGPNLAALELPANREVTAQGITGASPGGRPAGAANPPVRLQRRDVFDRFLAGGVLGREAFAAVRRLQDDVALLHRAGVGVCAYAPRVDRQVRPEGFTQARHAASERIEAALAFAGPASGRLLLAVCEPQGALGRAADWRDAVARLTGERLPDAQGAVLRAACDNLAGAYARLDRDAARARQAAMASRGSSVA